MDKITHLLDTNILSDLIRRPQGKAFQHLKRLGEDRIGTSLVSAAEIRFGCAKKKSPRLTAQAEMILQALPILPFQPPVDQMYGNLRWTLEKSGQLIGPNDLWIAAQALALKLILVTANTHEFSRVPNLRVVNWLR